MNNENEIAGLLSSNFGQRVKNLGSGKYLGADGKTYGNFNSAAYNSRNADELAASAKHDAWIEQERQKQNAAGDTFLSRNIGKWVEDIPAFYGAMLGGSALLGAGAGAGAGLSAGAAEGGASLAGAGAAEGAGSAFTALAPEAVWAGGVPAANAAVAGMGGAAGIGAAGGALGVAGAESGLLGNGISQAALPASSGTPSISALSPEAVQAGGTATASQSVGALTPSSIASAGGATNAAGATNYLDTAQKALKAGSAVQGLLGGGSGGQGGGMAGNSTQTNQIDPRMAKYIYGDGTTQGILDLAKSMYDKNPDGMNDQMRQGLNNQWNTLNDPALKQGYQHMANTGLGLMSMPIAGNPFTNGMGGRPQAMQQQQLPQFNPSSFQGLLGGAQQQQNPFGFNMPPRLPQGTPVDQNGNPIMTNLMSGSNSNVTNRFGG